MLELFNSPWAIAWYVVTCITTLFIQLNVFKKDLKYGLDVPAGLFMYGMLWVFCPILNLFGLLLWTYVTVVEQQED
jgi:hypothetical protein